MLQQTRIEAVIPYYHRFLTVLPDVAHLAACDDDVLMKLWEGLGYYSRARNLKKAAITVMTQYGGNIPESAEELKKLSGIGAYTAGAIASIAFGKPSPAVDGNVLRVLSRYLASGEDIALDATKKKMTAELEAIYPSGEEAALFTEGIMELGERICIPNGAPLCEACPLRGLCRAEKEGCAEKYPVKKEKKARRIEKMTVLILSHGGEYALRRRHEKGLLAGMWEFYHVQGHLSPEQAYAHAEALGLAPVGIERAGKSTHIFTHLEWDMLGYHVPVLNRDESFSWQSARRIEEESAIPTAFSHYKKYIQKEAH